MRSLTKAYDLMRVITELVLEDETIPPEIATAINDRSVSVYLIEDYSVEAIWIDMDNMILALETPKEKIFETILYDLDQEWEEVKPMEGAWKGEFLQQLMEKYPEAFKHHHIRRRNAEKLREQGLDIEEQIHPDGVAFTILRYRLETLDTTHIKNLVRQGIDILKQVTQERITRHTRPRQQTKREKMRTYLDIARKILEESLKNNLPPILESTQNWGWPQIETHYKPQPDTYITLMIYDEPQGYIIRIETNKQKTLQKLKKTLKPHNYKQTRENRIETTKPPKTTQQLNKHLETTIKTITQQTT